MKHDVLFSTMSPEGKKFYSALFNRVILNAYAVKHGLFDTLLCETDDPKVIERWRDTIPKVVMYIAKRKAQGLGLE